MPGAVVDGLHTAATLLNVGFWSLRERGWIELEQLRPVEKITTQVLGGQSFARVTAVKGQGEHPGEATGLEGVLWRAVRANAEPEGAAASAVRHLAGDDRHGVRSAVLAIGLPNSSWAAVLRVCFEDARAHGLLALKGRIFKKLTVTDLTAMAELGTRDAAIADARKAYRAREPDLDSAVLGDCFAALLWARSFSRG